MHELNCGVSQRSALGSLLFLVYGTGVNIKLFADDTNLFVDGYSLTAVNQLANGSTNRSSYWLIVNILSLNIDNTCYMVFPSDTSNSTRSTYNDQEIKKVSNCSYRYLGVIVHVGLK